MDNAKETPPTAGQPWTAVERTLASVLFLFSGASSLIYEVVWQKRLFLTFGASAPAITVVLAAFCAGLGLGGYVGAALCRRARQHSPWLLYGLIELAICLGALAFPHLLSAVSGVYLALVNETTALQSWAVVLRFLLALACLLPATVAMGATVPVMSLLVARTREGAAGDHVSRAYAANTFGAVAGCWVAGMHLVPTLGQTATLLIAYGMNLLCTATALLLSRRPAAPPAPPATVSPAAPAVAADVEGRRFIQAAYCAMGALAFGLEILAFRILAIYCTGGNVTFAVGLSVYLAGFALGSGPLFRAITRRLGHRRSLLFAAAGTGLALLVQIPLLHYYPSLRDWTRSVALSAGLSPVGGLALSELVTAGGIMLVPALFLGLSFPAACALLIPDTADLRRSGQVYLIGNLGALCGILLTALVIVPWAGLVGTYALLASCFVGLAWALARRLGASSLIPVAALALVLLAFYGLTGAPYFRNGEARRTGDRWELHVDPAVSPVQVLSYRAGQSATVMVKREPYATYTAGASQSGVYVDDQLVASTHPSAIVDSKMLAHLPLLLHPAPRRALTVGFGSGGTSWSMLTHGIAVDAVEIEPEVPRAAHHFEGLNHGVIGKPGFRVVINDARDHLRLTSERYDVISTDATNVQYKQNASLYSREYFELLKSRLAPGGIACAWLPFAALPTRGVPHPANAADDEFKILLRTFQAVFPHSYLYIFDHWNTDFAIVIGTPEPLKIDLQALAGRFARQAVKDDQREIDIVHPFQLIQFLYLDGPRMRKYTGPGWLHTDDLPVLERAASVSSYAAYGTFPDRMRELLVLRPRSMRPFLTQPPSAADGELLDRWEAFSGAWRGAIWTVMVAGLGKLRDSSDALGEAQQALETAWQGFGETPPLPRDRFEQLRVAIQQLRSRAPRR